MKALIADDTNEIRELLQLLVQSQFSIAVDQASDGEQAIKMIQDQGPYDIIISDYNMPKKNGGHVFQELRKIFPEAPFLLVTSEDLLSLPEFRNAKNVDFVKKPFDDEVLLKKIHGLFKTLVPLNQPPGYVGLSMAALERIGPIDYPLFIKLSDLKFVKVVNAKAELTAEEKRRYESKSVNLLYLEKFHYNEFILNFRKKVFSKMAWDKVDISESVKLLANDWELVIKATQVFGWSPAVMTLAHENVCKCLELISRNPDLKKIFDEFRTRTNLDLFSHCTVLSLLTTAIAKELGWESNMTTQKLTFAALLHDVDLDEDLFKSKQTMLGAAFLGEFSGQPEVLRILEHPILAASILTQWPLCPPDVDKIIAQHHEKVDGSGFPHQLNFQNISPLAAIFIMSEDVVYQCLKDPSVKPQDYLATREGYYAHGEFKKIFSAMSKVLQRN